MSTEAENLEPLIRSLRTVDELLPSVPPDEAKYLDSESNSWWRTYESERKEKASNHPASSRRFAMLIARPLYYVWETRNELKKAMVAVDGISSERTPEYVLDAGNANYSPPLPPYKDRQAIELDRAASAVQYVSALAVSIDDLLNHQDGADKFLASDQVQALSFIKGVMPRDIGDFIRCKVARIAEDHEL